MTRYTHLIILLLCLVVILRVGLSDPGLVAEDPVVAEQVGEKSEIPGKMVFNPEVPSPLPDLAEGYLFTQDRLLDESDLDALNKDGKQEKEIVSDLDLEEVTYSGSIIIGDLRKGLISYSSGQSQVKKGVRGATKGRVVMTHKQLNQGEVFKGFLVALVDEDRIVFERDGEKVEKLLYDQNKKRIAVKSNAGKPAAKASEKKPGAKAPSRPQPPKDLPQRRSQRRLKSLSGAGTP